MLLPFGTVLGLADRIPSARAEATAPVFKWLDARQASLLRSVTRTLFPHDFLPDGQYLKIVISIDAKAAADQATGSMIKAAIAAFPVDFAAMPEFGRETYLRSLEGSPFFQFVYQESIHGLYGDPNVASLLGFEGSSVEHGGYLLRGFDDISWLPQSVPGQQ